MPDGLKMEVENLRRKTMENDFITKKCDRCGKELKAPKEYPGNDNFLRLVQVTCPNHKTYTFDYNTMKCLR